MQKEEGQNILICGGMIGKEHNLICAIREIGFDNIIIADEDFKTIEIEPIKPMLYELPESTNQAIYRESNQKRCNYSTKITK